MVSVLAEMKTVAAFPYAKTVRSGYCLLSFAITKTSKPKAVSCPLNQPGASQKNCRIILSREHRANSEK